ncbi:hypothetical protein GCM10010840_14710 [Deinococcus aerolatus]|uniref:Uncharacterized protein n=1 Tax=Deinococcus aerolatus TaxID=522487 RepID=A0ABQ2G726_9DEIO|nr:hypothetical protein [Deinococcus aerolatus]GGL77879.1 hypothetical protein GCM10010840_14710 [Deinococcus aerolatus]
MPRDRMIWNPKAIAGVPEGIVLDMTRFIESGDIYECTWFVRHMLQCNFYKLARNAEDHELDLVGRVYRMMLADVPRGCFGSEEATLRWPGLRNIKRSSPPLVKP